MAIKDNVIYGTTSECYNFGNFKINFEAFCIRFTKFIFLNLLKNIFLLFMAHLANQTNRFRNKI